MVIAFRIQMVRDGKTSDGRIVWLQKPVYGPTDGPGLEGTPKVDRKNPDPSLRTRPLLDLKMVEGLEYVGDGQWKNGTIYTADTGKSYRFQAKLRPGGVLEVRGYAGLTPFGRTAVWTRVE